MTGAAALKPALDRTVRSQLVQELRAMIIRGELTPGQRLTEIGLSDAMGVSRAPLREAVRELVEAGLLVSLPYKGLFVRSVGRKDLEEIYSLRTALEQFAFRLCWSRRDAAAREDLIRRNATLVATVDRGEDAALAIEQELVLHNWCYELADHTLLLQSWKRMKPNLHFYFMLHQRAHARKGPLRGSHDVYVRLACGDDLDAMLEHLNDHMRQGLETTLGFIEG